jgi:hypothetical protein
MKLSIHETIRGKPQMITAPTGAKYYESGGRRVSLGWGWMNIEADWPDVFELITVDGCATSAELSSENRREDTFVSRELLMVDIDSGMSIPELFENEFYETYGAGFYTTPSHQDHAHRFRIMFRLEVPITGAQKFSKLNRMLLRVFTQADAACKDATRIFYGTPNCVLKERTDNLLPHDVVEILINEISRVEEAEMRQHSRVEHQPLDDAQRQQILDLLKQSFVGYYPTWRNIGWGLKAGGFELKDFQYVTAGMMNSKTDYEAREVWNHGQSRTGGVTMGSVIYFLRQRHGPDCLRTDDNRELEDIVSELEVKMKLAKEKVDKWQLEI